MIYKTEVFQMCYQMQDLNKQKYELKSKLSMVTQNKASSKYFMGGKFYLNLSWKWSLLGCWEQERLGNVEEALTEASRPSALRRCDLRHTTAIPSSDSPSL